MQQSNTGTLNSRDAIQGILAALLVAPKIIFSWTGSQADYLYTYFLVLTTLVHLYILYVAGPSKEEVANILQEGIKEIKQPQIISPNSEV